MNYFEMMKFPNKTIAYRKDNGPTVYIQFYSSNYFAPIKLGQLKEFLVENSKGDINEENIDDFRFLFYDVKPYIYENWFLIDDDEDFVPNILNTIRINLISVKQTSQTVQITEMPDGQIDLEFVDVKKRVRLDLYENDAISLNQLRRVFNDQSITGISFVDYDKKKTDLVPNYKQMILLAKDGVRFVKKYSLCLESPQVKKSSKKKSSKNKNKEENKLYVYSKHSSFD